MALAARISTLLTILLCFCYKTAMFDCGWTTNGRALHDVAVSLPIFLELWLEYVLVKLFRLFKCKSGQNQPAAGAKPRWLSISSRFTGDPERRAITLSVCLFYACVFAHGETFAIFLMRKTPGFATVSRRKARDLMIFLFCNFHNCQRFAEVLIDCFCALGLNDFSNSLRQKQ